MSSRGARHAALLGLLALAGCPHDLTRLRVDRATDRSPVGDRESDAAPPDRPRREGSPDLRCPSPCVTTFAGRCGARGAADGEQLEAAFGAPAGLLLESSSPLSLLVADGTNGVRRIAGGVVKTLPPLGAWGSAESLAPGSPGAILVIDGATCEVNQLANGSVTTVAGTISNCSYEDGPVDTATFSDPSGLLIDATLGVMVTDVYRIRAIQSGEVTTFAGAGNGYTVNGPLKIADFYTLSRLARGPDGAIYVSEYAAIRAISGGEVTTVAGLGNADIGFRDGPAKQALFNSPAEMVVDATGAMLVADSENHRIRRIANGQVSTFAGTGKAGFANGPAATAQFYIPLGLVVDDAGAIYVADSANRCIRVIR
jgi:hypothetical protein